MTNMRRNRKLITFVLIAGFLGGCSYRQPVTKTPVYHNGTPTNRSTVQSWELNREPFYTQPGVNSGTQMPSPVPIGSQRGFEPYDPLAERVYNAIGTARVNVKYITVTAKNGKVVITGSADNPGQLRRALDIAARVTGVRHVRNELPAANPYRIGLTQEYFSSPLICLTGFGIAMPEFTRLGN
jgi:hypothetical protein